MGIHVYVATLNLDPRFGLESKLSQRLDFTDVLDISGTLAPKWNGILLAVVKQKNHLPEILAMASHLAVQCWTR